MSKRNFIWLGMILVVGVVVWVATSVLWGLIAAGAVLVASEVIERTRRRRAAAVAGTVPKPLRSIATKRRRG